MLCVCGNLINIKHRSDDFGIKISSLKNCAEFRWRWKKRFFILLRSFLPFFGNHRHASTIQQKKNSNILSECRKSRKKNLKKLPSKTNKRASHLSQEKCNEGNQWDESSPVTSLKVSTKSARVFFSKTIFQ